MEFACRHGGVYREEQGTFDERCSSACRPSEGENSDSSRGRQLGSLHTSQCALLDDSAAMYLATWTIYEVLRLSLVVCLSHCTVSCCSSTLKARLISTGVRKQQHDYNKQRMGRKLEEKTDYDYFLTFSRGMIWVSNSVSSFIDKHVTS